MSRAIKVTFGLVGVVVVIAGASIVGLNASTSSSGSSSPATTVSTPTQP